MSKPHSSLSPTSNILLLLAWAAVAAVFLFVVEPHAPIILAGVGASLGAIAGVMQHFSFAQARKSFSAASTFLEVRSAFKATTWGTRYIRFLYFSKFVLIALAFVLDRKPILAVVFGYIAAYFSLMFVRELVTLRDTFAPHRLLTNLSNNEPDVTSK
jgi:hypothetical protein